MTQVLVADDASLAKPIAEPHAELLAAVQAARSFTHIVAPSSTYGKNLLPRAAALLDVQPISDAAQIVDADTYVRCGPTRCAAALLPCCSAVCLPACWGLGDSVMACRATAQRMHHLMMYCVQ